MTNLEIILTFMSFVSPIAVGIFVNSGVKAQIKSNESNISKQVKEQIKADREQRFWNMRLDSIIKLDSVYADTVVPLSKGKILEAKTSLFPIVMHFVAIFKGEESANKVIEAFELLSATEDGLALPSEKAGIYNSLISDAISDALNKLGAFE